MDELLLALEYCKELIIGVGWDGATAIGTIGGSGDIRGKIYGLKAKINSKP